MDTAGSRTLTLLFTDIERSTELLQKLGDDEARKLWRTHFGLLRTAVEAGGGQEVKNLGDGLMVVFASALDALACAVAMQQSVYRHNQRQGEQPRLQVRVGMHVGEPIRDGDDYFGTPVVIAKRLCDCAHGGQIVVSDLVRRLVGSRGGYTFQDMGLLSLKGISEPFLGCEVLWDAAVEDHEAPLPLPPLLESGAGSSFVGRVPELAQLGQNWKLAREGQRRLALLAGEPGIGKTRLAAEFAAAAHAEGANVLFGRTEERAALPYQPFVEAVRQYLTMCPPGLLREQLRAVGAELSKLMPEVAQRVPDLPVPPPADEESERYRLFDAFAAFLTEVSQARPLVLILDDLHGADERTPLLLKHIVRWPEQSPLLILATYRETEISRTHPLSETLADLRRDRAFERILLKGLRKEHVDVLIGAWIGQKAPAEFIRAIFEQTEGNPFFIEEILRHLAETGVICQRDGRWMADLTIDQMGIPEGVKEVIRHRLLRLSRECNSVLTIASVIGREFGLDALERASDLSGGRLLDLLEEAMEARVVTEVPHIAGRYSFSHALIHEALYDELTTTRRVHLHGQTLQYADNNGVKLAYEVLGGKGPYLVALGLGNCPAVRTRNVRLAKRWDRFSRCSRLVLYDRRGVGFSAAPEEGYSLLECVEDLRAVLDAVGTGRAVLWGSTDGGPLAVTFAAWYPDRVAGLILAGTTPKLYNSDDFELGINPALIAAFVDADASDRSRAVSHLTIRHNSESARGNIEVMRRIPKDAWYQILLSLGTVDARPFLAQVRAPTLIIHDPANNYIPVKAAYYLHEHIPGSRLEITEEYGAEFLGEKVYHTIESFVEEVIDISHRQP